MVANLLFVLIEYQLFEQVKMSMINLYQLSYECTLSSPCS